MYHTHTIDISYTEEDYNIIQVNKRTTQSQVKIQIFTVNKFISFKVDQAMVFSNLSKDG